jgi:hypothetical protein
VVQPITICRRLDGWKPIIKECHSLQLVAAYCGFFLQRQWGVGEQSASLRQEASVSVSYHGPKTGGIPPAKGVSSHQACGRPRRVAPRWVLPERSVCFSWAYSRRALPSEDRVACYTALIQRGLTRFTTTNTGGERRGRHPAVQGRPTAALPRRPVWPPRNVRYSTS